MIEKISSSKAAPPGGPYSSGIRVGDLLFVSGQGPFGPGGELLGTTFTEQAHVVFDNIAAIAEAAGTSLAHTVRVGAYLTDMKYFPAWNEVFAERLSDPYPARTTIPVQIPRFDIEVDAVIWVPPAP
jgi:reactive intermediate/imine deaminase